MLGQPVDFLTTRVSEALAVLRDSDEQTRAAAIRALVSAVQQLPARASGSTLMQAAEHYARLLRDFPGSQYRALQGYVAPIAPYTSPPVN